MADHLATKGQLQPDAPKITLERFEVDERFGELARQVWVPRWNLPADAVVDQPVLSYPGINIAIETGVAAAYLPVEGVGHRELTGSGWAAGLLLRPGAGALVVPGDHSSMLGEIVPIPESDELVAAVRDLMARTAPLAEVGAAYEVWLTPMLDRVDDELLLVNAICDAAETDPLVRAPRDLYERFGVPERTMQRLLRRRVGYSPRFLVQRRRLQEAAFQIREQPDASLGDIAADLGYADQAHFTRDFGAVIGMTPGDYRRSVS